MAYNPPLAFSTSEVPPAAKMNQLRDSIIANNTNPSGKATSIGGTTMPHNTQTVLTLDTNLWLLGGVTRTGPNLYTSVAGHYLAIAQVNWASNPVSWLLQLVKEGTDEVGKASGAGDERAVQVYGMIDLAAGSYVGLQGLQASGASMTAICWLLLQRMCD